MAARATPTLDQGPPLPQNLQPAQPTVAGLTGQSATQGQGSASLQQAVVQKLMFVEQALNDVATMLPDAAPVASGLIDQLRKGMGAVLAKGAEPPQASNPFAGAMMMPGGAPTS